jgi:hypothetical protein
MLCYAIKKDMILKRNIVINYFGSQPAKADSKRTLTQFAAFL